MCLQIAANSLMHKKLEVFVGIVIYSYFQIIVLDGDSLSLNSLLVSSAYFLLFLLIGVTKGHILFKDLLLHLRASLFTHDEKKKVVYFSPIPQNCMGKRWKAVGFLKNPIELPPLFALFFCYRFCDSSYLASWRLILLCPVHI